MIYWADPDGADKGCTCIHLEDGARIRDPACTHEHHHP